MKLRFALVESEVDSEGRAAVDEVADSSAIVFIGATSVDLADFASHAAHLQPTETALS